MRMNTRLVGALAGLALLAAACGTTGQSQKYGAFPQFPPAAGGGGSGTVTSVAATAGGLLAVAGTPTVAPTVGLASQAANTVVANATGAAAVATAVPLGTGIAFSAGNLTNTGVTSAVAGSGISVSGSTGAVTVTASLTTGLSGGQTVIGDTAASGNLILSSTAHPTKGAVAVGSATTGITFNQATNWIGVGTGTTNLTGLAAGSTGITLTSTGAVPVGINFVQGTAAAGGAGTALATITVNNSAAVRVFEVDFTTAGTTTTGGMRWYLDQASTLSLIVDSTNGFQFSIPVKTNTTLTVASTFSHTGSSAGFFTAAPAVQQTVGALTNSVTAGGTTGTVADFSDLTVYSNSAPTIRNNFYQVARSLNQITTALRNYGLGI